MSNQKNNDHQQQNNLSKAAKQKVFLKASDFFLDLAKLIFAGVILTGIMDLEVNQPVLIVTGVLVTSLLAFLGYIFYIRGIKKY